MKTALDATKIPEGTPFRDFGPCKAKKKCEHIEECWQDGSDPKDCAYLWNIKWPEPNQL